MQQQLAKAVLPESASALHEQKSSQAPTCVGAVYKAAPRISGVPQLPPLAIHARVVRRQRSAGLAGGRHCQRLAALLGAA